jgi:hypothetical protein
VRCVIALSTLLLVTAGADAAKLARLKYNNPGLVVDLAAGLWAFPLPIDFDGDGSLDLLVDCPDKPYNGVWNGDGIPDFLCGAEDGHFIT